MSNKYSNVELLLLVADNLAEEFFEGELTCEKYARYIAKVNALVERLNKEINLTGDTKKEYVADAEKDLLENGDKEYEEKFL